MGKCANCQNSGWFLETIKCKVCGKEGCKKCFIHLFQIVDKTAGFLDDWYACSEQCVDTIATRIERQISANEVSVDTETPPIRFFVERVVLDSSNAEQLSSKILKKMAKETVLHVLFRPKGAPWSYQYSQNPLWKRLSRYTDVIKAKHYETLSEFENAVEIYKNLGMYEKAGRARAKAEGIRAQSMESEQQTGDYGRTIEKLTLLFSRGKMSEESYLKAIKTIEEKMNELPKKTARCPQCGKEVPELFTLCPHCGFDQKPTLTPTLSSLPFITTHAKKTTGWWYLVPLFFGILGGLVGYVAVKDEDKHMADTLLLIGILVTFVGILASWGIYARGL